MASTTLLVWRVGGWIPDAAHSPESASSSREPMAAM
jgi:hypothetical protein